MLLKLGRIFGVSIAGFALANTAWAAEGTNVTTDANSLKLGGEFRSELLYDDHGLDKSTGFTPDKTTTLEVQAANIKFAGNYNKETEFAFRFNLLGNATPLQYGYGTHWFTKMVGMSMGKMRVMQGGYDHMDESYRSHTHTVLDQGNLAVEDYTPMIALTLKVAGEVKLQILNDVVGTKAAGDTHWNKSEHPTWVLGWQGQFGGIFPNLDIGSFDNNKSRWFDVGIKTSMAGLNATLDFYNQNQVDKTTDLSDPKKNKEEANVATSIALNVGYEIKGVATPWFHFSTFDNKQASDKAQGLDDSKVNGQTRDARTGATTYGWNDNGVVWGLGADLAIMGKGWTPYVAIVNQSGKFDKNGGAGPKVEEESKSQMQLKLGVLGEI